MKCVISNKLQFIRKRILLYFSFSYLNQGSKVEGAEIVGAEVARAEVFRLKIKLNTYVCICYAFISSIWVGKNINIAIL